MTRGGPVRSFLGKGRVAFSPTAISVAFLVPVHVLPVVKVCGFTQQVLEEKTDEETDMNVDRCLCGQLKRPGLLHDFPSVNFDEGTTLQPAGTPTAPWTTQCRPRTTLLSFNLFFLGKGHHPPVKRHLIALEVATHGDNSLTYFEILASTCASRPVGRFSLPPPSIVDIKSPTRLTAAQHDFSADRAASDWIMDAACRDVGPRCRPTG